MNPQTISQPAKMNAFEKLLVILMVIGAIATLSLIGLSFSDVQNSTALQINLLNVLIFGAPLFVLSGMTFIELRLIRRQAHWFKIILMLILGLAALYFVSLPVLLGGL